MFAVLSSRTFNMTLCLEQILPYFHSLLGDAVHSVKHPFRNEHLAESVMIDTDVPCVLNSQSRGIHFRHHGVIGR